LRSSSHLTRSSSSSWMVTTARSSISAGVTKWRAGKMSTLSIAARISPVRGSIFTMRSISSPKNSTRMAKSS
jgi:hypothetical protein